MPSLSSELSGWKPVSLPGRSTVSGRTVTLEPLTAERHAAALWHAVDGHNEVWTYLADGPYRSEADLAAALKEKESSTTAVFFGIMPKTVGVVKGYASYMRLDPANGVIEVGNILLSPSLQRTVAATEAMYLMARYVFENLGYRRYEWKCNANNEPSRRAALRLGFTFEGIFRQHMVIKGQNRDTAWYSMLDSEWPSRKAAFESWLDPANFDDDGRQKNRLTHRP